MDNTNETDIHADIHADIQVIMNQTNYTLEEATNKLTQHNFDKIRVIKEYLGISLDAPKNKQIKSINQEIYKQIRKELDISMYNYNKKNPLNIEHVIRNFEEAENKLRK
jgi:replication fork clamp-binding protein CrfC